MDNETKALAARIAGIVFLGIASIAFFLVLALVLAPYELDSLERNLNAVAPAKIVEVIDLAFPQIKQVTLEDVRVGCMIRAGASMLGATIQLGNLPLSQQDLDFVCSNVNKAQDMDGFKMLLVSAKFTEESGKFFSEFRRDYLEPYENSYRVALAGTFLLCLFASLVAFYFAESGMLAWAGNVALHAGVYGFAFLVILTVVWLRSPSLVEEKLMENPQVLAALALVPEAQEPAASILVNEALLLLSTWVEGVLVHLMLIYGAITVLCAGAWLAVKGVGMAGEESAG